MRLQTIATGARLCLQQAAAGARTRLLRAAAGLSLRRLVAALLLAAMAVLAAPTLTPGAGLTLGAPTAAQTMPVLRYGNRGPSVTRAQWLLKQAGYRPGPVDGAYGHRTRRAVVAFQRAHGLRADGVVGARTWRALGVRSASTGFVWPTRDRRITSNYGWRNRPCAGCSAQHKGVDIAGRIGDPVLASKAGKVQVAGWQRGYGQVVYLNHGGGSQTRYAHLSAIWVGIGQWLRQGQVLGAVGNTGTSSGPHLHFEIRRGGRAVDPRPYLS